MQKQSDLQPACQKYLWVKHMVGMKSAEVLQLKASHAPSLQLDKASKELENGRKSLALAKMGHDAMCGHEHEGVTLTKDPFSMTILEHMMASSKPSTEPKSEDS